jgi:thiazole synthase ThiGH ThiG subunit
LAFVIITSRAVVAATPEIVMFATTCVEDCTLYEFTVMPVPEKDSVGVAKFVPFTVKVVMVAPWTPEVGETAPDGTGAPLIIVNEAAKAPVCVSAFVIITSRAVKAAL